MIISIFKYIILLIFLYPGLIKNTNKLKRFDEEPIYADGNDRTAIYSSLQPEPNLLKVGIIHKNSLLIDNIKPLSISISPPFIKNIYFYALLAIGLIISIHIIARYRSYPSKNQTKVLERKIKSSTIEIENQKSEIEAQKNKLEIQQQALLEQANIIEDQNKRLIELNKKLEKLIHERTRYLEEAKNKAEESNQLKTAFLTNLSHEIRTPMNAIIGFAGLLSDPEMTDEQRTEFISHINHNSASLLHMLDDIIDVSKIDSQTIEISENECSLNVILVDLYSTYINYKTEIGKNHIDFRITNPHRDENIKLITDSYRLRQIFSQLLNNAFKYTDEGYIEFGVKKEETRLLFYVKDTGIGIPESKKDLIFESFTKFDEDTRRQFMGTGIGLTLSKKLTQLLGGDLWVDTSQEAGSVFYFMLPCKTPKEQREIFTIDWHNKNIMVAEDEKENFLLLRNILDKTKANIIHVKNGKEALDRAKKQNHLDLILMDLRMPVMSGIESTIQIRKINKEIPIIGITAYTYSVNKKDLIDSGFTDLVTKPLRSNQFVSFLIKYIGK